MHSGPVDEKRWATRCFPNQGFAHHRRRHGVDTRPDLGDRQFTAAAPDRLWVADIPSCRTFAGWVYCAYVLDVFSRCALGWHCSTSLRTELALYTLEFGLWTRTRDGGDTSALAHHSYRAVQYFAVRYTERLVEAGAVGSVGSVGSRSDCDNALAEAFNSLCKAVLVRLRARVPSLTAWSSAPRQPDEPCTEILWLAPHEQVDYSRTPTVGPIKGRTNRPAQKLNPHSTTRCIVFRRTTIHVRPASRSLMSTEIRECSALPRRRDDARTVSGMQC